MTTETLIEREDQMADLTDMIDRCASAIAYKWKDWAEYDDLYQEGWLWVLENRAQIDRWLAEGRTGLVSYWLRKAMVRYAKKEKADRTGASGEEEYFYTLATLRRLLPVVLPSDGIPARVADDLTAPKANLASAVRHGNFEAVWVDVRRAYEDLPPDQQRLLWAFYIQERTGLDLAREAGVTEPVISARLRAALLGMQKTLGGPPPE